MEMTPIPDCWSQSPLHQAVKNNDKQIVTLLLENKADPNAIDHHGNTPILLAGANKSKSINDYEEIVRLLIRYGANVDANNIYTGATPLHNAVAVESFTAILSLLEAGARIRSAKCGQTPLHEAAGRGQFEILSILLQYDKTQTNQPDKSGRTPLHKAAFAGSRECIELLLEHGADLSRETSSKMTVMDVIFKHVPRPTHLLKDILDKKITSNNEHYNSPDFKLKFDFEVLAPSENKKRQLAVTAAMIEAGKDRQMREIMQHPLIGTFLRFKWERLRIFFTVLVITYIFFVISLSIYSILIIHDPEWSFVLTYLAREVLLITSFALLLYGIVQIILAPRRYLRQYEMWVNLICLILSFIIGFLGDDTIKYIKDNGAQVVLASWLLHFMSIAILLAWIQLMMMIGRYPIFGYYALMFTTVLQNVVKVLLTFVCLIIGFSLSFSIQFHMQDIFDNPWKSIVKTIVMMMGEYEYTSVFPSDTNTNTTNDNTQNVPQILPWTSRIVFLGFILLSSIVLMNLMVGLAVNDIQELRTVGLVQRLIKQATFLNNIERILSHWIFNCKIVPNFITNFLDSRRCLDTKFVFKPGQLLQDRRKILPIDTVESAVVIALNGKNNQTEESQMSEMVSILRNLQKEVNELKQIINTQNIS